MTRQTIDFGIDLGTTNSAIAVSDNGAIEVLRNNQNVEFTPSAVTISSKGTVRVGAAAKAQVEDDPGNAKSEFKARMGISDARDTFTTSGVTMTPTELSAAVLKSLKSDVATRRGEDLDAAVITIPAAFGVHQVEATRQAAELAGITAETLQEPTAAAYAYLAHDDREIDREFWLVYDLGGGTFDAAVMSLRDGECKQIAHHGDNHLGGKNIDWALVDELLLPAVRNDLGWTDIARGTGADPRWRGSIAKLKAAAEDAKISLSGNETADIVVDLKHADGRSDTLEATITRADLERIATPFYRRSVELSRKALENAGLSPRDIAKIALVGGSTITPAVQRLLADPTDGLGIAIDRGIDPVTVVARGAAVFAATRLRSKPTVAAPVTAGTVTCELNFEPVSDDPAPLIGGTLSGPITDWTGHTVQFRNPNGQPPWDGARIPVQAGGSFTAELRAQDGTNTYTIELSDSRGSRIPVTPDTLVYRLDPQVPANQTVLPGSIGIGLADRSMEWIARAGTDIGRGHRQTTTMRTTQDLSRSTGSGVIAIPVLQGENAHPDRNRRVGKLEISATQVLRDVPAGTPVEVEVSIDASQRIRTSAYVPLLDQDWEAEFDAGRTTPSADALTRQIAEVERRIVDLESRAETAVDPQPHRDLAALRPDERLAEIKRLRSTAADDPADADACESRLVELQVELDRIEDAMKIPEQMAELDELRTEIEKQRLSPTLQAEYDAVVIDIERAGRDADLRTLTGHQESLRRIHGRALVDDPTFPVKALNTLRTIPIDQFSDPERARTLLAQGQQAKLANNQAVLMECVGELISMLPAVVSRKIADAPSYDDSTVRR